MMTWHLYSAYAHMSFARHFAGDFGQTALSSLQVFERKFLQMPPISETRPGQNTGNFVPYSLREVHGLTSNQYREGAYGL